MRGPGRRIGVPLQRGIPFLGRIAPHHLTDAKSRVSGIGDDDFVDNASVLDSPVGALDEAVLVDPRKARQRADQSDVGPFRRLDGANPTVVCGMHVTHVETGTLAGQATRTQC